MKDTETYYSRNRDKLIKKQMEYNKINKGVIRIYQAKYYAKNKIRIIARRKSRKTK